MSEPRLRGGFSGDLTFYGTFEAARDPARLFLRANHHNVVNVEGPVTAQPERAGIGPTLVNPPDAALPALPHLRCGVATLANNHTLDCGAAGLAETLAHLAAEGIRPLGAGRGARGGGGVGAGGAGGGRGDPWESSPPFALEVGGRLSGTGLFPPG